jgi:hypothetical protein
MHAQAPQRHRRFNLVKPASPTSFGVEFKFWQEFLRVDLPQVFAVLPRNGNRNKLMSERAHLAEDAIKDISQRLSGDLSLRLPASLQRSLDEPVTPQQRKEYVTTLLERDPGVFLERYANKLLEQERAQFEPLRDDYEVDFYLKLAEDEAASAAEGMSATAKNRRLAQLNRLIDEGKYFSEDAMRGRAPLLHQQYLGQYAPAATSTTAPTLSGTLLRQHDEEQHRNKLQQQQEQEDLVEEEEDTSSDDCDTSCPNSMKPSSHQELTADKHGAMFSGQQLQNSEDFLALMHQRFLAGDDKEYVDYAAIDKNAALDDDWAAQAEDDAQEKYFDAD